ncbi:MAG TPA: Ig-like domain-containing protein, partial [Pseudomonadales bacterium]|nr:Ig-like domain-containing protein [Pseudomonadales bacterium]
QEQPTQEWLEAAEALRDMILNDEFSLQVEWVGSDVLGFAKGAFAQSGLNGQPMIYLNADMAQSWLEAPELTSVLVEELGHAIDFYLNGGNDTEGDEGHAFATNVLGTEYGTASANDHGTIEIDGQSIDVEFAQFNFVNAYQMITDVDGDGIIDNTENWAEKEQESHTLLVVGDGTGANSGGLGAITIDDQNYNSAYFSGNDVSAIGIKIGGVDYYGWISRPVKVQGKVVAFYFWTDQDFNSMNAAQSDGNQDNDSADLADPTNAGTSYAGNTDPGVLDNKGFILVVDQAHFDGLIANNMTSLTVAASSVWSGVAAGTYNTIEIGSSSDRVDNALNSLIVPNSAPVAANDSLNVAEGSNTTSVAAANGLLANDSDPDGDALSVTKFVIGSTEVTVDPITGGSFTIAGKGTVVINKDGSYSFTPVAGYNGPVDLITYTISDGNGGTASAVLSIIVTPVNDAPFAYDNEKSTNEDTPVSGNVLLEKGPSPDLSVDYDPDGDTLSVTGFTVDIDNDGTAETYTAGQSAVIANVGTITLSANGSYTFTPATNYNGAVPDVTYTVSDGNGGTASAVLSLTVVAVNDAPVASDEAGTAVEAGCDVAGSPAIGNLLTNVSDSDVVTQVNGTTRLIVGVENTITNSVSTVSFGTTSTSSPASVVGQYGTLSIGADGSYIYEVNNSNPVVNALNSTGANTSLTETFVFTVSDASGAKDTATLTVTINGSNDAPVAVDDFNSFEEQALSNGHYGVLTSTASNQVLVNDTDFDNAQGDLKVDLVDGDSL